ncbi:unnamed protein product [Owenia fusiformis]|uniref:Ig-like domain-containing protein n=1 Tax=Owenia fusiformis TaxID=6347 RepID=A0A8S4PE48_OWEFU|nr:unnamed protein product [Owenia fusiformis]
MLFLLIDQTLKMKQTINQYSYCTLFKMVLIRVLIAAVCNIYCINQVCCYNIEDVYLHGIEKASKGHTDLPNTVPIETFLESKYCEQRGENSKVIFEERSSMYPKLLSENGSTNPDSLSLNIEPLKYGKLLRTDTSDNVHIACLTANKTGTLIRQSRRQRQHDHHYNTPHVNMTTNSHCVEKETPVILTCNVDTRLRLKGNVSYLQPWHIKWVQNTSMLVDTKMFLQSTKQFGMGQWKSQLTITNMSYEHEGRYMCVVIFKCEWMTSRTVYLAISKQLYGPDLKFAALNYPKWPQPNVSHPMKTSFTVEVNSIYGIMVGFHGPDLLEVKHNRFKYGRFYEMQITCLSSLGFHGTWVFSKAFYCPSHRVHLSLKFTNLYNNGLFIIYLAIPKLKLESSEKSISNLHQYSEGLSGIITPPLSPVPIISGGENVTHKATISIPQGHYVDIMVLQNPRKCAKCDIRILHGTDTTTINGNETVKHQYQYGTNTTNCDIEVVAMCTYSKFCVTDRMLFYITWEEIHVYGHGLLKESDKYIEGTIGSFLYVNILMMCLSHIIMMISTLLST